MRWQALVAALALTACGAGEPAATPPPAALTPAKPADRTDRADRERRRAFLRHYAPVILQRASETPATRGQDWIANAFFDGDRNLANNARRWRTERPTWIAGRAGLAPQPTLYAALIEAVEEGASTMVLLYHVYHPAQRGSIHDWERIELRLDKAGARPGHGERVRYVVVTEHRKHNAPSSDTPRDVNFLDTPQGRRLLVWQADQFGRGELRKGELHFVEEPAAQLTAARARGGPARVDINGAGPTAFHYVYTPACDPTAGDAVGAQALTPSNAAALAAGVSAPVRWPQVKALTYELQDLADLLPTHLDPVSWRETVQVRLTSPVLADDGRVVIPTSPVGQGTAFLFRARNEEDPDEDRKGYPHKHWFWGTYEFDRKGNFMSEWVADVGGPLPQHDYFLHDGKRGRSGRWLKEREGWWKPERGGFDGRWIQLFRSRP